MTSRIHINYGDKELNSREEIASLRKEIDKKRRELAAHFYSSIKSSPSCGSLEEIKLIFL